MGKRMSPVLLGTFLISFSLLSFEITTVRTINFVVGPGYIYSAIALAMLGLSAAGAILSLIDINARSPSRDRILVWLCVGIAILLVASQFLAAGVKADLNLALQAAGRHGGWGAVVKQLIIQSLSAAVIIGGVLLLPYFLFGALLSYLFVTTDRSSFGAVYAADLFGAALGGIGAVALMEETSYALSVTFPSVIALLAAGAYAIPCGKKMMAGLVGATLVLAVMPLADWYERAIEPPADPNYLVRNYDYKWDAKEVWHGWNSFTRVGAVSLETSGRMALGDGVGNALLPLPRSDRPGPLRYSATTPALLLDPPKDSLVLFAGAGADIISLREHGAQRITGVEINRILVNGAMALKRYALGNQLSGEKLKLVVSEGRGFLERDRNFYDLILLSYSGAPASFHAGMLTGTVESLYTYEGLAAILKRLKPDGQAVFIHANKFRALGALRRYLAAHNIDSAWRRAIVLFRPGDTLRDWSAPAEWNPLLIKPSGWSAAEVERLRQRAETQGYKIAYAPGLPPHPEYAVYDRILKAENYEQVLKQIGDQHHRRYSIKTDDQPFNYDIFETQRYLSWDFWKGPFNSDQPEVHEVARWIQVVFLLIVTVFACLLIFGPLCILGGPERTTRTYSHFGYFLCVGAGFMAIEIGLMQKVGLAFDTPGHTIAIVLGSIVLFTGVGSLMSNATFAKGVTLRHVAVSIALYAMALYFFLGWSAHAILGWPLWARGCAVAALIAPGAVMMGHMFPQGLSIAARDNAKMIPWAWGINGALSTVTAGFAPLAAMAWGFNSLFLAGAVLYAVTILLPTTRSDRTDAVLRYATAEG